MIRTIDGDYIYSYTECKADDFKAALKGISKDGEKIRAGSRTVAYKDKSGRERRRNYPLYTYDSLRVSFDIETTTVYGRNIVDGVTDWYSAAYEMTITINDRAIICRRWPEVQTAWRRIVKRLGLTKSEVLLVWVHNLDYETSYYKHRANIDGGSFFGKSRQRPIKYLADGHLYYHDSFTVTGTSLKKLAEMYDCKHRKQSGEEYDYKKLRNSSTELSEGELYYCAYDGYVLTDFAAKMFDFYKLHGYIPDTSTQILARDIEASAVELMESFIGSQKYERWVDKAKDDRDLLRYLHGEIYGFEYTINGLTRKVPGLVDPLFFTPYSSRGVPPPPQGLQDGERRIYDFYAWLYRGGYAKSNARWTSDEETYTRGLEETVEGWDYTSSYPFVQLAFNYPMGRFTEWSGDPDELELDYDKPDFEDWRYIFIFDFRDLEAIDDLALESSSKCLAYGAILDNGRIRSASRLVSCLTDCDYKLYTLYYKWDKSKTRLLKAWRAKAAPLPEYFTRPLCEAGVIKAKYKHVTGKEVEYALAKGKFNSSYGLSCKQPVYINYQLSNILTSDGYETTESNIYRFFGHKAAVKHTLGSSSGESYEALPEEIVDNVTFEGAMSKSILSPFWGIWCSAFARYNLLRIDKQISDNSEEYTSDVIYNDTDSFYMRNPDKHRHIVDAWNKWAAARIERRLGGKYPELLTLGQLDNIALDDSKGEASQFCNFKTLGSKRYLKSYRDKAGELHTKVTIAGLPKGIFEQYCERTGADIYEEFVDLQDFTIHSEDIPDADDDREQTTKHKIGRKYHDKLVRINVAGEIMEEYSSCTLYETTFKLKLDALYKKLVEGIHRHDDGGRALNDILNRGGLYDRLKSTANYVH